MAMWYSPICWCNTSSDMLTLRVSAWSLPSSGMAATPGGAMVTPQLIEVVWESSSFSRSRMACACASIMEDWLAGASVRRRSSSRIEKSRTLFFAALALANSASFAPPAIIVPKTRL